jgi:hypothetical protein
MLPETDTSPSRGAGSLFSSLADLHAHSECRAIAQYLIKMDKTISSLASDRMLESHTGIYPTRHRDASVVLLDVPRSSSRLGWRAKLTAYVLNKATRSVSSTRASG